MSRGRMSAEDIERMEDEMYRQSDAHFFRCRPTRVRSGGENLDIPAFVRRGVKIKHKKEK